MKRAVLLSKMVSAFLVVMVGGCGPNRHDTVQLDLPAWFEQAANLAIGSPFVPDVDDPAARETLTTLGYTRNEGGTYTRRINLIRQEQLVPSAMSELPTVDAIAVVSVYRPNQPKQYLYSTLRSLFAEFPDSAQVNVLVGTKDVDYVEQNVLVRELGEANAQRVHIVYTPQDIADHFIENNFGVSRRASWNYSRALLSYSGTGMLLLLEDDVEFATGMVAQLSPWLSNPPADAVSLFNRICRRNSKKKTLSHPDSLVQVDMLPVRRSSDFPTIQAMLYTANVTRQAGEYLAYRSNRETHDYMLGRVFAEHSGFIGLMSPSVVQHTGLMTSGLSSPKSLPISRCYRSTF